MGTDQFYNGTSECAFFLMQNILEWSDTKMLESSWMLFIQL